MNNNSFEVTKNISIEEIEELQNNNLEFIVSNGKLYCLVPEMD